MLTLMHLHVHVLHRTSATPLRRCTRHPPKAAACFSPQPRGGHACSVHQQPRGPCARTRLPHRPTSQWPAAVVFCSVLESSTPITDHARAVGDWPLAKAATIPLDCTGRRASARPPRLMAPADRIGRRASAAGDCAGTFARLLASNSVGPGGGVRSQRLSQKGRWGGGEHIGRSPGHAWLSQKGCWGGSEHIGGSHLRPWLSGST